MTYPGSGRRIDVRRAQAYEGGVTFANAAPGILGAYDFRPGHYTLSGARVASMIDFSGRGNDLAMSGGTTGALYNAIGAAFACPTASFGSGGGADYNRAFGAQSGLSVVMVLSFSQHVSVVFETAAAGDAFGLYSDNIAPKRLRALYQTGGNAVQFYSNQNDTVYRFIATCNPVPATAEIATYQNLVLGTNAGGSGGASDIDAGTWHLGSRGATALFAAFELAAVAIYDHALTATERGSVQSVLETYR